MAGPSSIIEQAVAVRTTEDLDLLARALSDYAPHRRPVGDRWGNRGLFTAAGGNFDHKLTELVTNMHDAVLVGRLVQLRGESILTSPDLYTAYPSPAAAVGDLFSGMPFEELADLSLVELRSAGDHAKRDRSVIFRDRGIGMSAQDVCESLFRVGSSRKDGVLWQLGAFGRGGLTVLPNCYGLVVVTTDDDDPGGTATVTTVRWEKIGNRQTETAVYQVVEPWETDGDQSLPALFVKADVDFARGTHVGVIGFRSEGIWVSRLGDERSLDTIVDTRLFEAPLPTTLTAPVFDDRNRKTRLRGLGRRLRDNPRADRAEGAEALPFRYAGATFKLPIRFYLFETGDTGARRRFVAKDHALALISNGQVHAHWTPSDFRNRTRLKKLADRILVVLDTDPLPLELRTSLFTADRTELLRNPDAVRLEAELIGFLDDWDELNQANNEMIRQAIRRSNSDRPTFELSQRIARTLSVRAPASGEASSGGRNPRPPNPRQLLDDPTELIAPPIFRASPGETKGVYFALNAKDGFVPGRTSAYVDTNQLDVDPKDDITIGELKNGRVRVAVAVPADAEEGEFELTLTIGEWLTSAGALSGPLAATVPFHVESTTGRPPPKPASTRTRGDGGQVAPIALLWTSHEHEPAWTSMTVGSVDSVEASVLAQEGAEYATYEALAGDVRLVKLNEDFSILKTYAAMRSRGVGDEGVARAKERYALGVAVNMLIAQDLVDGSARDGRPLEHALIEQLTAAAARGVLAVLPEYDKLTAEIGLDDL